MGGSSKQTIGYRYFMGLHMAICHGPVDSIDQIYVGKRSLEITPQTANASVFLRKPDLFGGDKKEGGILGDIDLEFGAGTQTVNSYLASQLGVETPSFRGVTCGVFRETTNPSSAWNNYKSPSGGGFIAAMSPYPKPWAFAVTDIPGGNFNPTKQIVDSVANGGHIIYDCLIDSDWGLGIDAQEVDVTSFTATTNTLFTEGLGLSLIYAQQSDMESFIQIVLTHINGVLYTSRSTGKYILKLIRDDYDAGTLPVFDEANIISMQSFERPSFAELVNEIVVTYRKRDAFEDSTIAAQDLASIQAQGGIISQTVDFSGIDNSTLAAKIADRELAQSSTPLARSSIIVNRDGWDVNPGDVIKVSWGAYSLVQIIMRVVDADYGTLESGVVKLTLIEDIFSLPTTAYLAPVDSGWQDEVKAPVASSNTLALELPYFVIETTFAQDQLNELLDTSSFLQSIAENPDVLAFSYDLHTNTGGSFVKVAEGEFSPTAQLVAALDHTTKLTIAIKNFKGSLSQIVIGGYAYLNGEALRIDSVDATGTFMDVGRGYLDTIPQSHLIDDIVYFADTNNGIDPTFYEKTDVVNAKVLPQTSIAILDIADATQDTVTMAGRRIKPYPPSQVKINDGYFPSTIASSTVGITWEHQDRTQQLTVAGDDWYTIALGSQEVGVLYTVRYYNNDTSTLLFTDASINGKSSIHLVAGASGVNFNMRVEVEAIRDGTEISFILFSHIFDYTKELEVRALENTNIRTLENGDRRVLES